MKRYICAVLSILLLFGVLVCCLNFAGGSLAYADDDNSYKFSVDDRVVELTSSTSSDGTTRINFYGFFFGDSGIEVTINIYSSPNFPIDFAIGSPKTDEQLATRQQLVDTFTEIVRFVDRVDDLSNALFDGSDEFGNVTECFSDVYRYNHPSTDDEGTTLNNGVFTIEIAKETYEMLTIAQEMYNATSGAFNPAVYRLVDLWGFSSRIFSYGRFGLKYDRPVSGSDFFTTGYPLPDAKYVDAFSDPKFTDFSEEAVKLTERDGKYYVTKNVPRAVVDGEEYEQWIDLGGIAKGYAVDVAKSMIKELGIECFDVDAGSSSKGYGWGIKDDQFVDKDLVVSDAFFEGAFIFPRSAIAVKASNCAISTSGQNMRKYTVNGIEYSHIVDGDRGIPAQTGVKSVTVVVPDDAGEFWATKGDCLTTALTVMGYDRIVELRDYLEANGIKIIIQYETITGNHQLATNYKPSEITYLYDGYNNFELDGNGFYIAEAKDNVEHSWWDNLDRTDLYKWILIGLGVVFGALAVALVVYHLVRGKNRTLANVQGAKKGKAFKMMDILVYMLVVLLVAVLLFSFVLDRDEVDMQVINVIDYDAKETLFTYNVLRNEYIVNDNNVNGWTIEVDKHKDHIDVTFTREFNGKERYNVMRITTGSKPSVTMMDAACGFNKECVRNFDDMTHVGDVPITCKPNRLKIVTAKYEKDS